MRNSPDTTIELIRQCTSYVKILDCGLIRVLRDIDRAEQKFVLIECYRMILAVKVSV